MPGGPKDHRQSSDKSKQMEEVRKIIGPLQKKKFRQIERYGGVDIVYLL